MVKMVDEVSVLKRLLKTELGGFPCGDREWFKESVRMNSSADDEEELEEEELI